MATPLASTKRAKAISLSLFLTGLAITAFLKAWWPGILLTIGIPLSVRQFLLGKTYDACLSLFIFAGIFLCVLFNLEKGEIALPVILIIGSIYVLFREFTSRQK